MNITIENHHLEQLNQLSMGHFPLRFLFDITRPGIPIYSHDFPIYPHIKPYKTSISSGYFPYKTIYSHIKPPFLVDMSYYLWAIPIETSVLTVFFHTAEEGMVSEPPFTSQHQKDAARKREVDCENPLLIPTSY